MENSTNRSAIRHAARLTTSDRSVRRILHLDLRFHPYRIQIVHALNSGDYEKRIRFCEDMLSKITTNLTTCEWAMRRTSIFLVLWRNKISDIGQIQTLVYFMKHLFTLKKLRCGDGGNKPHCKKFNECCEYIVPEPRHFTERKYPLAPSLSRFNDLWFFFLEVPKDEIVWS